MKQPLQELVEKLDSYLPQLAERRDQEPMANDCYEAAWYWRDLGRRVLEGNTRVNYPERVKGEYMLLAKLREILQQKSTSEQQEFGPLLDAGAELLNVVEAVKPPEEGHLGFLHIVREQFKFLQSEFGFAIADEQPTSIRFSSGAVSLELAHSINRSLSCQFALDVNGAQTFWIDDLLYLNHDERYLSLPERLELDTEEETEGWFKFLAQVFQQYGEPLFQNAPGSFDELKQAQAERDAAYVQEMNRKHLNYER
jgi:hypothetical protein